LRKIEDDDGLSIGAISGVGEGTHGDEDGCDSDHNAKEDFGEFLWMFHGFLDGDDETNAFESEDCCSDAASQITKVRFHFSLCIIKSGNLQQRPTLGIKVDDISNTLVANGVEVVVVEVP